LLHQKTIRIRGMRNALDILRETLVDNRSVLFTIGNKGFFRFKVDLVAKFLHSEASRNTGIFLDSHKNGIICFFEAKNKKNAHWWNQFLLIFFAVGPFRIFRVLKRKQEVELFHQQFKNYIHCSYLAVRKEARGSATIYELRNALFNFQTEKKLPILIETTIEKNKRVYERIGFHVYEERKVAGLTTYCMIKELTH
jgi:hypothetical protein